MPLDEYKLDNLRLEQLMNALEQCVEVDSVRQLRMVNLEQIIATKDSVIAFQVKQLSVTQSIISELDNSLSRENKKVNRWRSATLASVILIMLKQIAFL